MKVEYDSVYTWAEQQSHISLIDISKPDDWYEQGSQYIRPVAYSCGSFNNNLKCSAYITGQVDSEYEGQVRFVWSGGGASGTSDWVDLSSTVVTAELEATFAEIFGIQKSYYNSSTTLTWEYRIDDEEHGIVGVSMNPIYVTYDDPLPDTPLYHTVVHTGCIAANGVGGTEQAVFDAVWSKFESLSIPKVIAINGLVTELEELTYYGKEVEGDNPADKAANEEEVKKRLAIEIENGVIQAPSQLPSLARYYARIAPNGSIISDICWQTEGLLSKWDGTCGAWQDFAVDVFAAQGIQVNREAIVVNSEIEAFKVKSDAVGQGTDSPKESIWGDHAVIEYAGNVYDPSYGVEYGGKADALFNFMELSVESVGVCLDFLPIGVNLQGYGVIYESLGYLDYTKAEYYFEWI